MRRNGSALVSALMILMVVVGLVAALAPLVRVDVRAAGHAADDQRALYLARGGVNLALAALEQDEQQAPNVDGLDEDWATLGAQGQTVYPLGEGQFRLEVIDASSRLDLNQVDQATLSNLPGIDATTASEILAWRSQNAANSSSSGSSQEYESLPRPYQLKAAPFDSVEELLLVQGVTPLLLYGPQDGTVTQNQAPWVDLLSVDTSSPNTDSSGRPRINLNTATAQQLTQLGLTAPQVQALVQGRPYPSLARLLSVPGLNQGVVRRLVDRVTLTPGAQLVGKLNVNTAPLQVLETLPGVTSDIADQIVQRRESTGDFQSVGDLLDLGQAAFQAVVDRVTTKSSVFLVRARGELPNGTVRAVEARVRRSGQNLQVTRWRVVPRTPGWNNWGWDSATGGSGLSALSATPHY